MSYDLYIVDDDGNTMRLGKTTHDIMCGTYVLGGTNEAHINITYNYAPFFKTVFGDEGIRTLYGRKVSETFKPLLEAANKLHGRPADNYWESTEGNARKALIDCIALSLLFPEGTWQGD
jgi:hypothetical protein